MLIRLKVVPANLLSEKWFKKLAYFARLIERIDDVEGDVVECGVAAGKSFVILASLVRSNGQDRCVWGFDSWVGRPSPSAADEGSAAGRVAFSKAIEDAARNDNGGMRSRMVASPAFPSGE